MSTKRIPTDILDAISWRGRAAPVQWPQLPIHRSSAPPRLPPRDCPVSSLLPLWQTTILRTLPSEFAVGRAKRVVEHRAPQFALAR